MGVGKDGGSRVQEHLSPRLQDSQHSELQVTQIAALAISSCFSASDSKLLSL